MVDRYLPEGTFFLRKIKKRAIITTKTSTEATDAITGTKKPFFSFGLHELNLHSFGFPSRLQGTCDAEINQIAEWTQDNN